MVKSVIDTIDFIRRLKTFNGVEDKSGVTRLAFSEEDIHARMRLIERCMELDLEVEIDGAGNIWARKSGENPELPSVLFGSHIDTVPEGGEYDGILGVLSGLEVIKVIKENNIQHERSIELICFAAEESSRFNISTVGSKLLSGKIDSEKLKKYTDSNGICLYDRMIECGFNPNYIENSQNRLKKAYCFLELHIEQGPVLENKGIEIGIVHTIAAPTRLRVIIVGEEAHSGTCPIDMRKDALVASAEMICAIEKIAKEEVEYHTITTVGKCKVFNEAINTVPGTVEFFVDIRGIEIENISNALDKIYENIKNICLRRKINYFIEVIGREHPVKLNEKLNEIIKSICIENNKSILDMNSGAGHDTMNIASIIPATLIFIPCVKGISHNKKENVQFNDVKNGLEILYNTVIFIANDKNIMLS